MVPRLVSGNSVNSWNCSSIWSRATTNVAAPPCSVAALGVALHQTKQKEPSFFAMTCQFKACRSERDQLLFFVWRPDALHHQSFFGTRRLRFCSKVNIPRKQEPARPMSTACVVVPLSRPKDATAVLALVHPPLASGLFIGRTDRLGWRCSASSGMFSAMTRGHLRKPLEGGEISRTHSASPATWGPEGLVSKRPALSERHSAAP